VSRIGKKIIEIPKGVTVTIDGSIVKIKGPKGELQRAIHPNMKLELKDSNLEVKRPDDQKTNKALHGLTRALVQNMIIGVTSGYKKVLDIVGVGYRVELKGTNLLLNMGYSHPIYFMPPAEIKSKLQLKLRL